jgi:cmgb10
MAANNKKSISEQEEFKDIIDDTELEDERVKTRKLQAFGVIAFAAVALVLGLVALIGNFKNHDEPEEKQKVAVGTNVQKGDFSIKEEAQKIKELVLEDRNFTANKEEAPKSDPFVAKPEAKKQVVMDYKPRVYKSTSSLLVSNASANSGDSSAGVRNSEVNENGERVVKTVSGEYVFDSNGNFIRRNGEPPKDFSDNANNNDNGSDNSEYETAGVFTPKSAKVGSFDPNLYLSKGTYIGCSLDTRLVSTIKGGISCTVSENIYSTNGTTLLIEKGSKITGFFNSGQMNDGMDRIFVVWSEIRTPNNIIIPVSSGASDELGGSGIPGYVDHHWLERFGSAILLSIIDDATNVALNGSSGTRNNNNINYVDNTRETTMQMANTALEKFINIQPTLYKNHGDIVGVYVNRDIDFSKVYKLNVKRKRNAR